MTLAEAAQAALAQLHCTCWDVDSMEQITPDPCPRCLLREALKETE